MPLKFRLKGLAETFIDEIRCPKCGHDGGDSGDEGFSTDLTKVTYNGIVVVIRCGMCQHVFVPGSQRFGIINSGKLRDAVERDSINTGQPIFRDAEAVSLDVERLNASESKNGIQ